MKNSMLDGKRLIELPDKTILLVRLEFSEEEREVYKMVAHSNLVFSNVLMECCCYQVEARTQANFNRFLRAGTVLKCVQW